MKIAVLGTRGFPDVQGGIERHCQNLYPKLAERGCDITVFTRKPYVNPDIKNYKGVKLITLNCTTNKFIETISHTLKGLFAAKKLKPDILHIHAVGPSLVSPLARLLGMKVVMTTQGPDYKRKKWGFFAKFVLKLGERLGSRFANEVISVSQYIRDDIKARYNKDSHVIPNGVEIPEILKPGKILEKYNLRKDKYILTVGRFVPEKGFADLIEDFNKAELGGWKLVIVGKSDHESEYSRTLEEKAAKDHNIVLTGFLSGAPLQELYSHAGLFVLPSYYEGLPLVLLEAMSYGLLCLVSDIPANRCVGLPDENYFTAGDIKQLSEKLKDFIKKSLTLEQKSRQIEMVREKYDWGSIAEETLKVYNRVIHS